MAWKYLELSGTFKVPKCFKRLFTHSLTHQRVAVALQAFLAHWEQPGSSSKTFWETEACDSIWKSRVHLKCPLTISEMGQSFTQHFDVTALWMCTLKDAHPGFGDRQYFTQGNIKFMDSWSRDLNPQPFDHQFTAHYGNWATAEEMTSRPFATSALAPSHVNISTHCQNMHT